MFSIGIPRLEYDKIFNPPRSESFNWKSYFIVRIFGNFGPLATGTNPCTDEVLFGHVRYLEQTVAERLFEHGKHIFVKSENDNERVARIELCCQGKLIINYLNTDDREKREDCDGEITVLDVVTDGREVEQSIKRVLAEEKDKRRKWDFLDVTEVIKYKDVFDRRLNDLIEEDQYFEIQDAAEPRCVFCCRVLANYGGIVVFEVLDYIMTINITDPRCHPIGWASRHQDESVAYCPGKYSAEAIRAFSKNPVPEIIFRRNELKEHLFKVVAHRGSHGIFPQGFCDSIGFQLSVPHNSIILRGRGAFDAGWSWKSYAAHWGISGVSTNETNFEPLSSRDTKITPMRHVEVFCYQQGVMYAALIHRAVRNLVLIELSCDTTPNPPLMFPIGLVALLTLFFAYQVLLTIR
ncbi:unnamed protein product [Heligmosomoides polygyrus]|uniref:UPF0051 protein n=1 Tax=Heligmosomoides polygyrus TaxID=6339 RepID=A0A183GAP5_HELPZ|nr:unnamed protein product [Heligmosomoides polygyrus]